MTQVETSHIKKTCTLTMTQGITGEQYFKIYSLGVIQDKPQRETQQVMIESSPVWTADQIQKPGSNTTVPIQYCKHLRKGRNRIVHNKHFRCLFRKKVRLFKA